MKRAAFLVVALLFAGLAQASSDWLARVDGLSAEKLASRGLKVLMELDGYCLVQAQSVTLAQAVAKSTLLDENPAAGFYVYVLVARGFARSQLSQYGRILTQDPRGVVLKTSEDGVNGLNRLPVELALVPKEPLVISGSGSTKLAFPAPPDSLVWLLVNRVSQDSVKATIQRLQDFYTRYSTTDSCRHAVEWIRSLFAGYNCDSTALETYRSNYAPNVIGVKHGTVNPRPIYVICGHADNTSEYQPTRCPGSDDNASGTTAVIEACRVFADMEFDNTVYFIGFTGEEQGLVGSDSFCRRAWRRGDSIKAALNFDMISYGRQNVDTLEVIGKISNPDCAWLVDFYIAQADTFSLLKTKRSLVSSAPYSDHDRFWARGYPAFCGIELDFTPEYHTIGDTVGPLYYTYCGTNNVPMATEAIKSAVASIAKLAGAHSLVGVAGAGQPLQPTRLLRVRPSIGRGPFAAELSAGASSSRARLQVYDAAGNLIRTLRVASGLAWDGMNQRGERTSPGIYLFRLADGNASSTATLVVAE